MDEGLAPAARPIQPASIGRLSSFAHPDKEASEIRMCLVTQHRQDHRIYAGGGATAATGDDRAFQPYFAEHGLSLMAIVGFDASRLAASFYHGS